MINRIFSMGERGKSIVRGGINSNHSYIQPKDLTKVFQYHQLHQVQVIKNIIDSCIPMD